MTSRRGYATELSAIRLWKDSSPLGIFRTGDLNALPRKERIVYLDRPHARLWILYVDNFGGVGNVQELGQAVALSHDLSWGIEDHREDD